MLYIFHLKPPSRRSSSLIRPFRFPRGTRDVDSLRRDFLGTMGCHGSFLFVFVSFGVRNFIKDSASAKFSHQACRLDSRHRKNKLDMMGYQKSGFVTFASVIDGDLDAEKRIPPYD